MKFCPFLSTATEKVSCSEDCALFIEDEKCAITKMQVDIDYIAAEFEDKKR